MENNNKGTGPINPKPIFWLTHEPKNSMQNRNLRLKLCLVSATDMKMTQAVTFIAKKHYTKSKLQIEVVSGITSIL